MSKIYIVTCGETNKSFEDPIGIGDDGYNIVKVFKSFNAAKNYVNELYEVRIKELKERNANIEYQNIDADSACIYWNSREAQVHGITDYIIHEHELAK